MRLQFKFTIVIYNDYENKTINVKLFIFPRHSPCHNKTHFTCVINHSHTFSYVAVLSSLSKTKLTQRSLIYKDEALHDTAAYFKCRRASDSQKDVL